MEIKVIGLKVEAVPHYAQYITLRRSVVFQTFPLIYRLFNQTQRKKKNANADTRRVAAALPLLTASMDRRVRMTVA